MGTKLDYAINLLATSSNQSAHLLDDWETTTGALNKDYQRSAMDRRIEKHNIRRTMQIHEDIFKHQVEELHRVYSVQKMLMRELKKEIKQNNFANQLENSASYADYKFHIPNLRDDHPTTSGSCSAGNTRRFNLAAEEGRSCLMPDKKTNQGCDEEESEVELSLSIGGSFLTKKKSISTNNNNELRRKDVRQLDSLSSFKLDRGSSPPNTPGSSSSAATVNQEQKQHWLFQGLSINRT
jgi:hypothetical protein